MAVKDVEGNPMVGQDSPVEVGRLETVQEMLKRSKRTFLPLSHDFIQHPRGSVGRSSVLAKFMRAGDKRALLAYLLILSATSSSQNGIWFTSLSLQTWARAMGCFETATGKAAKVSASKILKRLEDRNLIDKQREGRSNVRVVLKSSDGTGAEYKRPKRRYVRLSYEFWEREYDQKLGMPAIAMLLVLLGEKPGCALPLERFPEWYGWSADTAQRGLDQLSEMGIVEKLTRWERRPLSPEGVSKVSHYYLQEPFDSNSVELSKKRGSVKHG